MATMSIKTFLSLVTKLPKETSVLTRGPHGIGKSQVIRQAASMISKNIGKDLPVIDRRLSQMSEGDMIGLPSTDGEVTRFNPPDWYKAACKSPHVLFLDEINRATPEVMQAAFQIVLDRELNGWKLHPDTRVFAAVNASSNYTVNEMDPALLDRFWTIDLEPTVEDWLTWAKGDGKIHDNVVDFIAGNTKWLDPPKQVEPGAVTPSRRSWERLNSALVGAGVMEDVSNPLFYSMSLGYIGTEATIAFHGFVKTIDAQVTGEEILQDYDKVAKKVKKLGQEKQNILIDKVAEFLQKEKDLTDVQGANLRKFMKDLPGELRVSCWSKIIKSTGATNMNMSRSVHKHCVDLLLETFGTSSEAAEKVAKEAPPEKKSAKAKKGA